MEFFNYCQRKDIWVWSFKHLNLYFKTWTLSSPVNFIVMVSKLGFFIDNKEKDLCLFRHTYLYLAPELIFQEEIIETRSGRNETGWGTRLRNTQKVFNLNDSKYSIIKHDFLVSGIIYNSPDFYAIHCSNVATVDRTFRVTWKACCDGSSTENKANV